MAPAPDEDRGAPAPTKQDAPRGSDAAQRPPPADRTADAAPKPQRPQARERFFAPGEDGECH